MGVLFGDASWWDDDGACGAAGEETGPASITGPAWRAAAVGMVHAVDRVLGSIVFR